MRIGGLQVHPIEQNPGCHFNLNVRVSSNAQSRDKEVVQTNSSKLILSPNIWTILNTLLENKNQKKDRHRKKNSRSNKHRQTNETLEARTRDRGSYIVSSA